MVQINEWKTRRDFYVRFADAPHEFIQEWLISQAQDLKVCCFCNVMFILFAYIVFFSFLCMQIVRLQGMSEYGGEGEIERKAEYYFQPTVQVR